MEAKEYLRPLPYRALKQEGLFHFMLGVIISLEYLDTPEEYKPRIARLKRLLKIIPEKQQKDREDVEKCIGILERELKELEKTDDGHDGAQ